MDNSLVSIIVTTKNSSKFIGACLRSMKQQTYKNIEIIVVDNNSSDNTKEIAMRYTVHVYDKGPERSAQRNYGVNISKGDYVLIIDSDMELYEKVVEECVTTIKRDKDLAALVIPEESFGEGFWAQCKKLERSFYTGVEWMEAARFFRRESFALMRGYDEKNTGTEDYDLPQRIKKKFGKKAVGTIAAIILHNEARIDLRKTCAKKFYYAQKMKRYKSQSANTEYFNIQSSILQRYKLFLSRPGKILKNPLVGFGMLFMKTSEFIAGGLGYLKGSLKKEPTEKCMLIVSHFAENDGVTDYFIKYLKSHKIKYYLLKHPFYNSYLRASELIYFNGDNEAIIKKYKKIKLLILELFRNFMVSSFLSIKLNKKISKVYGFGSFNTVPFIWGKKIWKRKVIFWGVDYSTQRFGSALFNRVYLGLETLACKYADLVIQPTKRQEEARIIKHDLDSKKSLILPNGINILDFKKVFINFNEIALLYIGSITKQHGIIDFVKFYIANKLSYKLYILGTGECQDELIQLIKKNELCNSIIYLGHKSQVEIISFLGNVKEKLFGLAPYNSSMNDHVYFGDSLKIKEYLNYNIPFITTEVTYLDQYLKEFGFVYNDYDKLLEYFNHDLKNFELNLVRKKAAMSRYNWEDIFQEVLITT